MRAYVGVDWSATEVACSVAVGDGPVRRIKGARRSLASVRELLDRVRSRNPEADEIHVVIETGAPGWVEFFHYAGAIVHVADTKQARRYAESLNSSGAKDDGRDSDTLVGMGRSPDHLPPVWKPADVFRGQLEELGAMHDTLTRQIGPAQQRLRSYLRERFPALEAEIGGLKKNWALRLIRAIPTIWHAERMDDDALAAAMSGARETTVAKVIAAVRSSQAPWLTQQQALVDAMHTHQLVAMIELLSQQLAEVEAKLDALTEGLELRKQLEGVGGIAMKMATRLIEFAFEDVPEHRDQAGIALGACPVFRGSGKTARGRPKGKAFMRRAASPRARSTAYLLGRLASQQLAWAGRMYEYALGLGKAPATAYRRIARSLLRILSAIVRTGEPYDDARYEARLRVKGAPWALAESTVS